MSHAAAAHRGQAHFAQEIEIVLVEQHQLGSFGLKQALVLLDSLGQHGVEKRYPVAGLAQQWTPLAK